MISCFSSGTENSAMVDGLHSVMMQPMQAKIHISPHELNDDLSIC
jgi:hypothetical protein